MNRCLSFVSGCWLFAVSTLASAFQCYLTLMKDSCWTNYNVTVTVTDTKTNQVLTTVVVAQGSQWYRQRFDCQPGQNLMFQATFLPVFWQTDQGRVFSGSHYWQLPATVQNNATAWNIPICYPADFSEVPLPPDAKGNCQCTSQDIPPLSAS